MTRFGIIAIAATMLVAAASWGDSLFTEAAAKRGTFISDNKHRFEVGDIITVLVRENVDARTRSQLDTEKQSTIDAESPAGDNLTFVGDQGLIDLNAGELPNWNIEADNEHESEGEARRRNTLIMTIGCAVTRVYPNGNVEIRGEKRVTVNRDDSLLQVSGIARTRDVTARNTIDSNQLANAVLELKGQGPLWNNERRGIFTRLLDWISPF